MKRIAYRAAPDETAEIKGSEIIKGWKEIKEILLPNLLKNRGMENLRLKYGSAREDISIAFLESIALYWRGRVSF